MERKEINKEKDKTEKWKRTLMDKAKERKKQIEK